MTSSIAMDTDITISTEHAPRTCGAPDGNDWRLLERREVLFMRNVFACPACHLMQQSGGGIAEANLHVVVSGDHLTITEIDDIHQPGRILRGIRASDIPDGTLFHLLATVPTNGDRARHVPAEGSAVLTWHPGARRLKVIGVARGMTSSHGCIIDAVEDSTI